MSICITSLFVYVYNPSAFHPIMQSRETKKWKRGAIVQISYALSVSQATILLVIYDALIEQICA